MMLLGQYRAILVGTWWNWDSVERCWPALGGTGSVWGSTGSVWGSTGSLWGGIG